MMIIDRDMYVYADNADGYHAILIDGGNHIVGAVTMWGVDIARDVMPSLLACSSWDDVTDWGGERLNVLDADAADALYNELFERVGKRNGGARELSAADVDTLINGN